jgi:hypothetical protein
MKSVAVLLTLVVFVKLPAAEGEVQALAACSLLDTWMLGFSPDRAANFQIGPLA